MAVGKNICLHDYLFADGPLDRIAATIDLGRYFLDDHSCSACFGFLSSIGSYFHGVRFFASLQSRLL